MKFNDGLAVAAGSLDSRVALGESVFWWPSIEQDRIPLRRRPPSGYL